MSKNYYAVLESYEVKEKNQNKKINHITTVTESKVKEGEKESEKKISYASVLKRDVITPIKTPENELSNFITLRFSNTNIKINKSNKQIKK
jgi:hypothetical protein